MRPIKAIEISAIKATIANTRKFGPALILANFKIGRDDFKCSWSAGVLSI